MFERYTDRARRVVVLAQEEARLLNHHHIGTEHILLALVHEGEGIAFQALDKLGVTLDELRKHVEALSPKGAAPSTGHIPFSPICKRALELALREALQLGHSYIGTEHILLGLVREGTVWDGQGVGGKALEAMGVSLANARQAVIDALVGPKSKEDDPPPTRHDFRIAYQKLADGHEFSVEPGWAIIAIETLPSAKKVVLLLHRSGS